LSPNFGKDILVALQSFREEPGIIIAQPQLVHLTPGDPIITDLMVPLIIEKDAASFAGTSG
jgi:hypothetical protein